MKKVFHTFEHKGRKIIIGAISKRANSDSNHISLGHSVCNPKDKFDEDLGKKIAEGRALSKSELKFYPYVDTELSLNYAILKSVCVIWENKIKNDPSIVKGIK